MIPAQEVDQIADGWVEEFSVDPYVVRAREMTAWFKLDDLVHRHPEDALRVFEQVAKKDLINWTFEELAVGPVRSFLMLYDDRYGEELTALRKRNPVFDEMYAMAVEGL
jgi:hypothetical protein